MGTVLGLSLDCGDVVWVLVDQAGAVVDHDLLELPADVEVAGAAARGAQAIAATAGFPVDRVRLTWTADTAHDGMRLRSRLRCLGFEDVDAVPRADALAAGSDNQELSARLAPAYGAAVAEVGEDSEDPVPVRPARRRRRIASTVLVAAAAAVAAVLSLSAGAAPQLEPGAPADEVPAAADPGWVAVPAAPAAVGWVAVPSGQAPVPARKAAAVAGPETGSVPEVAVPGVAESAESVAVPQPAAAVAAPSAVPQVATSPGVVAQVATSPEPLAVPHLSAGLPEPAGVPHLAGTSPAPTGQPHLGGSSPEAPGLDMAELQDAFSALP